MCVPWGGFLCRRKATFPLPWNFCKGKIQAQNRKVSRNTPFTSLRPFLSFSGNVPGRKAPRVTRSKVTWVPPTWRVSGAVATVWGSPTLEGAQRKAPPAAEAQGGRSGGVPRVSTQLVQLATVGSYSSVRKGVQGRVRDWAGPWEEPLLSDPLEAGK